MSAFLLTLMSVGVFQGIGIFLVTLEGQFGWSRTALSGAFTFARVQGAVIGPIEGFLIDRIGSRRMIIIGYSLMGIGFILLSQIQSLWQFYGAFIIISLGSGLGGWLAIISMVNNWFNKQRSIALATAMSGIHFGGFLVPILALGIDSYGFRTTTFGMGVFFLVTVLPLTRLMRNRPEDYGMLPDGDTPKATPTSKSQAATGDAEVDDEPDFTARQALRTLAFWTITIVHLSSSVAIVTLSLHLVPKLTDIGMSLSAAGVVVLTFTAVALPVQFGAGYIADKLPKPPVIFVFFVFQGAALLVLSIANSVELAYLFAVLYGIGFGGRIPLLTAIRGEYFGRKAFATIMGLSQFPNNLVMMVAPLFAGFMFDTTGSYFVPFSFFGILTLLGAVLTLFIKKPKNLPGAPVGVAKERAAH